MRHAIHFFDLVHDLTCGGSFRGDLSRRLARLLKTSWATDSDPAKCRHQTLQPNRRVEWSNPSDIRACYDFINKERHVSRFATRLTTLAIFSMALIATPAMTPVFASAGDPPVATYRLFNAGLRTA